MPSLNALYSVEIINLDDRKKQHKRSNLDTDVYCNENNFHVQLTARYLFVLERYGYTHHQPKVI